MFVLISSIIIIQLKISYYQKNIRLGDREITQQLKAYTALAKGPSLIPGTHIEWLTTICNFSSKESNTSGPTSICIHDMNAHAETCMHMLIKIIIFKIQDFE